jgi:hypothetical protein
MIFCWLCVRAVDLRFAVWAMADFGDGDPQRRSGVAVEA